MPEDRRKGREGIVERKQKTRVKEEIWERKKDRKISRDKRKRGEKGEERIGGVNRVRREYVEHGRE